MKLSRSLLALGLVATQLLVVAQARRKPPKHSSGLVLRGHVKAIEIDEYDPQVAALIRISLEAEFVNTGSEAIILLKRAPLFVAAALAKTPQDFERRQLLAADSIWPSRSRDPEWASLRIGLDQPLPPADEIRILKPNESWIVDTTVGVTVPIDPRKYTSSRRKEKLEVLQALSPISLQVTCEIWPENVEGVNAGAEKLPFGHKLQTRWQKMGWLWLDDMRSEPMPLDLSIATRKAR